MDAKQFLIHKGIFDTQYIVDSDGESINIETLLTEYQALQLQQTGVSGSFSAEDMIKAFNAGGKHIYECEANGKDKKCYCRNDNDCNQRHYISGEEWLKNYR